VLDKAGVGTGERAGLDSGDSGEDPCPLRQVATDMAMTKEEKVRMAIVIDCVEGAAVEIAADGNFGWHLTV